MKEPTKGQEIELLKWCGFTKTIDGHGVTWIVAPNGAWLGRYPELDLNILFKYAVPKLRYCSLQFHGMTYTANVCIDFANHYFDASSKPALALFWALWQVMTEDKRNGRQAERKSQGNHK